VAEDIYDCRLSIAGRTSGILDAAGEDEERVKSEGGRGEEPAGDTE
jgi:hypothetical protein